MAYGKVKADAFIYDNSGTDVEVSLSGIPTSTDLDAKAPLASPTLTGTPAAPTAAEGTNTTQIATTAFVNTEIASKADLASPTLTGTPAAPTASQGTNTTQIATTAFVSTEIASKADLASPTFTGTPAAPTASAGTNTTQVATTAYVQAEGFAKTASTQTFTAAQRAEITALTFAATMTPDFAASNNFSVTLTGTGRIANPTNQVAGQSGSIFITQDGTGSRVLSWGDSGGTSAWYWAGGTAPTLSTGANVRDRVDYIVAANGVIHAVATLAVSANTP
tara:strand:+ start:4502 stop:5335 length:834 start_codon:yes stop_codon:yes gene_type:complete